MKTINSLLNIPPKFGGLFFIVVGIFFLIMAIMNPDWIFGNNRTFNLSKIDGWVNFLGRNTTRFFVGVISILTIIFGIFWLWVYSKK